MPHKIFWNLKRTPKISQGLLRSHEIYWSVLIWYLTFDFGHLTFDIQPMDQWTNSGKGYWDLTKYTGLFWSDIWHLTFDIWHLTLDIWHLTFVIWRLAFDIWHLTLDFGHLTFDLWLWTLDIWLLSFNIWHLKFDIWHLTFDIWLLTLTWHNTLKWYWHSPNSISLMDSEVILAIQKSVETEFTNVV